MTAPRVWLGPFQDVVLELLEQRAGGYTEYELLGLLAQRGVIQYGGEYTRDPLNLFRTHFTLFHALYDLRDRLRAQQRAELEIGALCIRLQLYGTQKTQTLAPPDPLRDYYLNWANLADTSAQDVERMLGGFWKRYVRGDARREALDVLGLEDPVDEFTIRRVYRKLAMQHHPDRGGDGERLQQINVALRTLLG
jgi:hypothetical protein